MVVYNNILAGASGATGAAGAFQIDRSIRLNSGDSAYLNRTPSSAGNRRTFTWSGWVKRTVLGADKFIFSAGSDPSNMHYLRFKSDDTLEATEKKSNSVQASLITNAVYRDVSAWMHIIYVYDSSQSTAADRLSLYVNGVEITSFSTSTYPSQNHDSYINSTSNHFINARPNPAGYADQYLTEIQLLDGTAVSDASDFGEYDSNNVWQPKDTSGLTFGTNGFYLKFDDNSSAAALGNDSSGNDNDFTVNNLSVASGSGNDSLIDTPTNYTSASGNNGGNYATLNPLAKNSTVTLSNGNLDATSASWAWATATIAVSSGKWYWELTRTNAGSDNIASGIVKTSFNDYDYDFAPGGAAQSDIYAYTSLSGNKEGQGSSTSYGDSYTAAGDVIGVALDMDAGTLTFYKNGVSQGQAFSGITDEVYPVWGGNGGTASAANLNFGQRPFAYTPPTGYVSLCTTNLPDPTIADGSTAFDAKLYTGTGSTQTISGLGFSPDLVWIKRRSGTTDHNINDIVRGAGEQLASNQNYAEVTNTNNFAAFTSDGFTVGTGSQTNAANPPETHVAWAWDAGSSTVSNTDGSITSSVRASQTAGFSIVTWTGSGTSGDTVGHGLNAQPFLILSKRRNAADYWPVYHKDITAGNALKLNDTDAQFAGSQLYTSTAPTSSVFSVGDNNNINGNGDTYVAYCFAPVEGYSAFGSYSGGSDAFVYLGFRPAMLIVKRTDSTGNWLIYDNARGAFNLNDEGLYANSSAAEFTSSSEGYDFLGNGFKVRNNYSDGDASGGTYAYMAWASHPFKTARAR